MRTSRLSAVLGSPHLLLVLTVLFWACNSVVARATVGMVPPVALAFWRWTIALCVILPFGGPLLWRSRHVVRAHWKALAVLSALSVAAYNTFLYLGLQHTTVVNASLVAAIMPVIIVALSWGLYRVGIGGRQALGIALSLGGVVTIVARGDAAVLARMQVNPGDLLVLTGVVSWAFYSVILPRHQPDLPPRAFLTAIIAIGLVLVAPLYAWELTTPARIDLSWASAAAIAYTGVFPSVLAYLFWNRGVHAVGPNTAGQFLYLSPVMGVGLGMLFLGEPLRLFHLAGIVLIFAGVWLATRRRVEAKAAAGEDTVPRR